VFSIRADAEMSHEKASLLQDDASLPNPQVFKPMDDVSRGVIPVVSY
jgi:hypothetical protein